MELQEETLVEIAEGKSILIRFLSVGAPDDSGKRTVFFKLNGQTRNIEVLDRSLNITKVENIKADKSDPFQIGAPLQGLLSKIFVKEGDKVKKNDPLFVIEAMKMETTIVASFDSSVNKIVLKEGSMVMTDDLVVRLEG